MRKDELKKFLIVSIMAFYLLLFLYLTVLRARKSVLLVLYHFDVTKDFIQQTL